MQNPSLLAGSSWEAFRLTSKPPSELLHTLGPHGVDDLIRQMLAACWRDSPSEDRTFKGVQEFARRVFDRNMKVWSAIKKPTPEAFFANMLPYPADGFCRQALVLCWMMLPRGKRSPADVARIVRFIFERNLTNWDADNDLFTKGPHRLGKTKPPTKKKPAKPAKSKKKK